MQPEHYFEVDTAFGEPTLKLVCAATEGAVCRMRPGDPRESWNRDDPDLVDSGICWAVEWVESAGFSDAIMCEAGVAFARIPVAVSFRDGVMLEPVQLSEPDRRTLSDLIWDSVDGKGIRGRLYREDADYLAGVLLAAFPPARTQRGSALSVEDFERFLFELPNLSQETVEAAAIRLTEMVNGIGKA